MKREVWSAHARADFDRHTAYLAERSPLAAQTFADAVLRATALLCAGDSGRMGRVEGTFEKSVRRQPFIILFEMSEDSVFVLRVVHTAMDWPEGAWPPGG